jgi:hypothetical protein
VIYKRYRCVYCDRKLSDLMEFESKSRRCWCGEPLTDGVREAANIKFQVIVRMAVDDSDWFEIIKKDIDYSA